MAIKREYSDSVEESSVALSQTNKRYAVSAGVI